MLCKTKFSEKKNGVKSCLKQMANFGVQMPDLAPLFYAISGRLKNDTVFRRKDWQCMPNSVAVFYTA